MDKFTVCTTHNTPLTFQEHTQYNLVTSHAQTLHYKQEQPNSQPVLQTSCSTTLKRKI